ncbi:11796_t:CDS:2 [Rhizophagus irregularis]|nr:11796_t:CDS:2 [Rhizophagus irregularis]
MVKSSSHTIIQKILTHKGGVATIITRAGTKTNTSNLDKNRQKLPIIEKYTNTSPSFL